ncbi:hypothetical protein OHA88_05550 [Streptomyces sp. NBC_00353]|uniref:hypothetical protein n=1 Tax=Streptomyces sp. NBC_00353 TaxID=2975722 RepID=UPI002E27301E
MTGVAVTQALATDPILMPLDESASPSPPDPMGEELDAMKTVGLSTSSPIDLRRRDTLCSQQRTENQSPPQAPSADDGTVIHTLTEALRRERTTHREHVQGLE